MADFINELGLLSNGPTQTGRTVKVNNCDKVILSVVVSVTAATLQATLALGGTSDPDRSTDGTASLAVLTGALASAVPGTVTLPGTGLLTFNNLGIGTQEVVVVYTNFPRFVRPVWTFTSGGGTVSVSAYISAWST